MYFNILIRENLFYVKLENREQNTASSSPRALGTKKNRERKGPSRGLIQKCAPRERSPCAPKFGNYHMRDLDPRTMRPQSSVGFGENIHKFKNEFQQHVVLNTSES